MDFFFSFLKQLQIDSLETPALLLLLVIPVLYIVYSFVQSSDEMERIQLPSIWYREYPKGNTIQPGIKSRRFQWKWLKTSRRLWSKIIGTMLGLIGFICLTIAIAHPYGGATNENRTEGIDIYFTMDMSASMKAYDYTLDDIQARYRLDVKTPNRFDTAKSTMLQFIQSREARCHDHSAVIARCDRIGISMFGQTAFIDIPLTTDYAVLTKHLKLRRIDDIDATQSAIGDGIMSAVASLRHSTAKSKNIILVSDGDRKGGRISIRQALAAAKAYDVHIFPIMIGASNKAVLAQPNSGGVITFHEAEFPVNYELLEQIAQQTGGIAYRAANNDDFMTQLNTILDRLEPSISKEVRHDNQIDLSIYYILIAFIFLLLSHLVNVTLVHKYP